MSRHAIALELTVLPALMVSKSIAEWTREYNCAALLKGVRPINRHRMEDIVNGKPETNTVLSWDELQVLAELHHRTVGELFNPHFHDASPRRVEALERDLRARFEPCRFAVIEGGRRHLVNGATRVVSDLVNREVRSHTGRVGVGFSGGPVQSELVDQSGADLYPSLTDPAARARVCFLAMNDVHWPNRNQFNATSIVSRLATKLHVEQIVPPFRREDERDYLHRLHDGKLLVVSAGTAGGSFVAKYPNPSAVNLEQTAVGDINYWPIDADGRACSMRSDLDVFHRFAPVRDLRDRVSSPARGTVLLLLSSRSLDFEATGRAGSVKPQSKARVALACLRGRLANYIVLPADLAEELIRL